MTFLPKCTQEKLQASTLRPTDDEAQVAFVALPAAIFCTPKSLLIPVLDENKPEDKRTQSEKEYIALISSHGSTVLYYITTDRFLQIVPYGIASKLLRLALEWVLKADRRSKIVEVLLDQDTSPVGALPAGIAHAVAKQLCAVAASLDQNASLRNAMTSAFVPAIKNPKYKARRDDEAPDTRAASEKEEFLRKAGPGFLEPEFAASPVAYTIVFTVTLLGAVLLNLEVVRVSGITDNQIVYQAAIDHFHSAYRLAFPFHCLLCKAVPYSKELANRMAASTAKAGNFGVDVIPTVVLDYARHLNFIEVMSQRDFDRSPDPQDLLNNISPQIMIEATRSFEPAASLSGTTPPSKKDAAAPPTTQKLSGARRDRDAEQEQAGTSAPAGRKDKEKKKNKTGVFLTEDFQKAYNNLCANEKLSDVQRTTLWKHGKTDKLFPKQNTEKSLKTEKLRELAGKIKKGELN
jgi:hypothetical protein